MTPSPAPRPTRTDALNLVDLAALVAGYGLAALLVRAFWPESRSAIGPVVVVLLIVYLWLGLAMTGPILVLLRRLRADGSARQSWAEVAWIMIGCYWIVLLAVVIPARLAVDPLLGSLPIAAALAYRWLAPRPRDRADDPGPAWTHRLAVVLLASWPLAWGCLLLLSKTLF